MDSIIRVERNYPRDWDVFDELYGGWLNPEGPAFNYWNAISRDECYPSVDVIRGKTHYLMRVELPGLTEKDFDLEVRNGELVISGKPHNEEGVDERVLIRERMTGEFRRTFELPDDIDGEHIEATLKNGLLEIKLPIRTDPTNEKHIKVEVH